MFKKIISTMLALMVVIGGAVNVSAVCASEEDRPAGIIGTEHNEAIKELGESWDNDELEIPYSIEMVHAGDYWVVALTGETVEGYQAAGFYDHYPTEEEIEILWANRVSDDELNDLFEYYGF